MRHVSCMARFHLLQQVSLSCVIILFTIVNNKRKEAKDNFLLFLAKLVKCKVEKKTKNTKKNTSINIFEPVGRLYLNLTLGCAQVLNCSCTVSSDELQKKKLSLPKKGCQPFLHD